MANREQEAPSLSPVVSEAPQAIQQIVQSVVTTVQGGRWARFHSHHFRMASGLQVLAQAESCQVHSTAALADGKV